MSRRAKINLLFSTAVAIAMLVSYDRELRLFPNPAGDWRFPVLVDGALVLGTGSEFTVRRTSWRDLGLIRIVTWESITGGYSRLIRFRLAPPLIVWGLLTLRHYVRDRRRRNRIRKGLCIRCGYDLRGSTQRCPECGTDRTPCVQNVQV